MVLSGRRIAVTGASGLVGRHLLALFAKLGVAWIGQSRQSPKGSDWRTADLGTWLEPRDLDQLFGAVDGIIHLAAALPGSASFNQMMSINVGATLALGEWALLRQVPMVFVSSSVVYGDISGLCLEASRRAALPAGGHYGLSKAMAEVAIKSLIARGLNAAILRPSSVYGLGLEADKLVTKLLYQALNDETILLAEPVTDSFNFVHAADLARAVAAVLGEAVGVFNVAGPRMVTLLELAQACVSVAGKGAIAVSSEMDSRAPHQRFNLDTRAIERLTGFCPGIDIEPGLRMMVSGALLPADDAT